MTKHQTTRQPTSQPAWEGGFQDVFQGTTAIYVIERRGQADIFLGDYEVEAMPESWPEQLRSTRPRLKKKGQAVPELPDASLDDKVLIAFGPRVSPQRAVAALERAIASIRGIGLLIGRDAEGGLIWERLDGSFGDGVSDNPVPND